MSNRAEIFVLLKSDFQLLSLSLWMLQPAPGVAWLRRKIRCVRARGVIRFLFA